ncbi:sodium/solute symporter [Planctomicrobium piriforme]|uniref:Cation/acetate symporter n=1 Tax=Planctomicrobium piriforme TaxID=1576369 RepID=A0A1I3IAU2_9PLAN|nr:cation acetate symporter [Planctomicrobium piriforme]SFI45061.1 cation/acetate symporter [Planctomicrobium piriforme]
MIYQPSLIAVVIFLLFVGATMGLSFYLGSRAKSSQGYFAAHGQIPWFINGVAFAGDYLSAASFLGICGMIAFYGYDGFLYSIGYLAGWIVALFVVAEPLKRLGKFTFADALDAKFQSRGIKLAVGISTLVVSLFYLIPQMVGAGVLVQPLLGLSHWQGVALVGATVIVIVVSAGMVSTTWVQFLKGALLVFFSLILTCMILNQGLVVREGGIDGHKFRTIGPVAEEDLGEPAWIEKHMGNLTLLTLDSAWGDLDYYRTEDAKTGQILTWRIERQADGQILLREAQTLTKTADGKVLVNGLPKGTKRGEPELHPVGYLSKLPDGQTETGPLNPLSYLQKLQGSEVIRWPSELVKESDGSQTTVFYQQPTSGAKLLLPGNHPTFKGIHSDKWFDKINFISLMLALFCGTASLPHILIRYYTVKDEISARKSTIVGIAAIGFFYVLTLYLGLGAMVSGALDVTDSNMAAPLLAKSMNEWLFAIISAIAFTTVLGTVSGLILASSGAVTHDLLITVCGFKLNDFEQVRIAKFASVIIGAIAIVLGIIFEKLNVAYLVGWAFSVAASANLPSLVMMLFWKGTTKEGVIAAVVVGMTSSLGWILLSQDTYKSVYGIDPANAIVPFSQPGVVTIPLGFLVLIVVSLLTRKRETV